MIPGSLVPSFLPVPLRNRSPVTANGYGTTTSLCSGASMTVKTMTVRVRSSDQSLPFEIRLILK